MPAARVDIKLHAHNRFSGPMKQAQQQIERMRRASGATPGASARQRVFAQQQARQQMAAFGKMQRSVTKLGTVMKTVSKSLRSIGPIGALAGAGISGLAFAATGVGIAFNDMKEQAKIAFTTMFKSEGVAVRLLENMAEFAKTTPFDLQGLIDSGRRLAAFGFTAEEILPTLKKIGDATAGLGTGSEGMNRIIVALGQMRQKGKVTGEEMMQLTEAGVPAWDILAEKIAAVVPRMAGNLQKLKTRIIDLKSQGKLGADVDPDKKAKSVLVGQLQKLASMGRLPVEAVTKALMDGMGERFMNLMDAQAETLGGKLSNLRDTFQQFMGDLAEDWMPALKNGVSLVTNGLQAARDAMRPLPVAVKMAHGGAMEVVAGAAPILGALTPVIAGLVGEIVNPAVGGIVGVGVGTAAYMANMAGNAAPVPAMAKGGIVNKPTFALIGEAGPEAVVPLSGIYKAAAGGVFGGGASAAVGGIGALGSVLGIVALGVLKLPGLIATALGAVLNGIFATGKAVVDFAVSGATTVWEWVKAAGAGAVTVGKAAVDFAVQAGTAIWNWLEQAATATVHGVGVAASWLAGAAATIGSWLLSGARTIGVGVTAAASWAAGAASTLGAWLLSGARAVATTVTAAASWATGAASVLGAWLLSGARAIGTTVTAAASWAVGAASVLGGWLLSGARAVGVAVTSTASWAVGAATTIGTWLLAGARSVGTTVSTAVGWASDGAGKIGGWFLGALGGVGRTVGTVVDFAAGKVSDSVSWFRGALSNVGVAVSTTTGFAAGLVADTVSWFRGVLSGVGNAARVVIDFVAGTVAAVVDWLVKLPAGAVQTVQVAIQQMGGGWTAIDQLRSGLTTAPVNVPINPTPGMGKKSGMFGWGITIPGTNIPFLAKGGIVNRPTTAVIGEAGPEAVIPLSRMGSMGGKSVHVHNHFNGPVTKDGEEWIRDMSYRAAKRGFRLA